MQHKAVMFPGARVFLPPVRREEAIPLGSAGVPPAYGVGYSGGPSATSIAFRRRAGSSAKKDTASRATRVADGEDWEP